MTANSERRYGRRWGRFSVSGHFLEQASSELSQGNTDNFKALMAFMAEVLIIRAGDAVDGTEVEYFGVSPHFDELEEGKPIPYYLIEFEKVRTCNACGGIDWGQPPTIQPGPHDPACKNCASPIENSRFVTLFKACRRV